MDVEVEVLEGREESWDALGDLGVLAGGDAFRWCEELANFLVRGEEETIEDGAPDGYCFH